MDQLVKKWYKIKKVGCVLIYGSQTSAGGNRYPPQQKGN